LTLDTLGQRLTDLQFVAEELRRHDRSQAWVYGHHMRLDPDDQIMSPELSDRGTRETFETELMGRLVRPGDTVLDVGANIGYYTLQFARQVGPQGHVFAFEPDPQNFALLKLNVRQNGYANVTLVPKAVAARSERRRLFRNRDNRGDHRIYASGDDRESVDIETVALDEFFAGDSRPIDFVKMDIQGAECEALSGMQSLLARNRHLRMFTEFWPRGMRLCGSDPEQFLRRLLELGFEVRVIDEQTERLLPLDIPALLARLPVEPDTDILFTNLQCTPLARDGA